MPPVPAVARQPTSTRTTTWPVGPFVGATVGFLVGFLVGGCVSGHGAPVLHELDHCMISSKGCRGARRPLGNVSLRAPPMLSPGLGTGDCVGGVGGSVYGATNMTHSLLPTCGATPSMGGGAHSALQL